MYARTLFEKLVTSRHTCSLTAIYPQSVTIESMTQIKTTRILLPPEV